MKSTKPSCALCSQPVHITGFKLETKEGQKDFCCEGCLSIYQLLNEDKLISNKNENNK
jgi:hypothetical protein